MRKSVVMGVLAAMGCSIALLAVPRHVGAQTEPEVSAWARGVVFEDLNGNGLRDAGEPGIAGVGVSDQRTVTTTDKDGAWKLPLVDDRAYFVIKPAGYMTKTKRNLLPDFHVSHKPKGSPMDYRFEGVAPTGHLPASVDFPLTKRDESDEFKVLLFADTQPYSVEQVDFVMHDVISELAGKTDASFGVTLGDIVGDNLSLFEPLNAGIATLGLPWYNVIGNHDINFDAPDDSLSDETFERVYAPNYYSFNVGKTHFVALDNVEWNGRGYIGQLDQTQLKWLEADLALVPQEHLVVLLMHIPITSHRPSPGVSIVNRQDLYRIIEKREHLLTLSGHMHTHDHRFIDEKDGWQGAKPLEHVHMMTVSGSWWGGHRDERDIPHATMRDGAPNGYGILSVKGNQYSLRLKAAGRPDDYQMNIYSPNFVYADKCGEVTITVNVFNGSPKSVTEYRIGKGAFRPMEMTLEHDPRYVEYQADERMPRPDISTHLWKATLSEALAPGSHLIEVRSTDCYGQVHDGHRVLRVLDVAVRPALFLPKSFSIAPKTSVVIPYSGRRAGRYEVELKTARNQWTRIGCLRHEQTLVFTAPDDVKGGQMRLLIDGIYPSDAQAYMVTGEVQEPAAVPAEGAGK